METWLRDHLIASGHLTETGLTRRARLRQCRQIYRRGQWRTKCLDLVLTGLDGDTCAMEVACDPTPLSRLGEALALVDGRRTLTLRKDGTGYVLDPRDAGEITWAPATSTPRRDVVRQHRCGTPPVADGLAAPSAFPEAMPPAPPHSPCPF